MSELQNVKDEVCRNEDMIDFLLSVSHEDYVDCIVGMESLCEAEECTLYDTGYQEPERTLKFT